MLIGLRDYQDAKADVILRYNPDEARNLKTYGELPESGEKFLILFLKTRQGCLSQFSYNWQKSLCLY